MDREKVIKGLEHCTVCGGCYDCPYTDCDSCTPFCKAQLMRDAIALLKAQEPADYIPIDWLMNYAQLPTEFAISAWRKPKKEAEIKQAKSLDKPMSLDDALELLKAQEPRVMTFAEAMLDTDRDVVWVEFRDDPIVEAAIPGFAVNEYADAYCTGFDSDDGTIRLSADQCGKIWRPWSLRPTDAQREAVKWE